MEVALTIETIRTLRPDEIERVAGATEGVVGGPNGEGCTEPPLPTKPGLGLSDPHVLLG